MALTNKELYEGIDRVRVEIQKDIAALRGEVNKIETSRIANLEKDMAVLKTKMMLIGAGMGTVMGVASSIIVAIATRSA